jgi:hypothetical protein
MCETLDLPRSPAEREETEKLKTTNYFDTFIRVAEDCPATSGMVPPLFFDKPTVAGVQHEMIAGCPYTYTSDDTIFSTSPTGQALEAEGPPDERSSAWAKFFSKGQLCTRASTRRKRERMGSAHRPCRTSHCA